MAMACVGAALFAAGAASAQTPNISGVWRVQGQIRYGAAFEADMPTCTFRQTGGVLGGVCVGPHARGPLSGMIAGKRVSWTWSHAATNAVGLNGRTQFNGSYVNGRLIKGSMTSTAIPGTGSFVQTR
jgi:hypothetical protein